MKKSISVSNLTLSLYLDYVRPAAIKAGLLEDAITEDGKPYHITDEAVAKEIESDMRCACFNANNDRIERSHDEYIANEAEQMIYQLDVSIKYCKDSNVVEALKALRDALLNGAQDWNQYSYGGCSLIYDGDIAERLCNPSELKKTRNGERNPNSRETWLDVQARALRKASGMILDKSGVPSFRSWELAQANR